MRTPTRVGLCALLLKYRSSVAWRLLLLLAVLLPAVVVERSPHSQANNNGPSRTKAQPLAHFAEQVRVAGAGRGNPTINLADGHAVITSFRGPDDLQQALSLNQAEPLSMATADFDEDGVPDLVSGYGYQGQGIVSLLRGNVDSIYPNASEAKQRRVAGTSTDAPFLSPARVLPVPVAVDYLGAGDLDGDGHWDLVVGSRTAKALYLLAGDGRGGFASLREIALPGVVTALTTGEINRADGLTDVVIGVTGERGSQVLVFEGPGGALRAEPEVFELKTAASSLALGQLDSEYTMDLAIAAGNEVLLVHGRDRKLSLDQSRRAKVPAALTSSRRFDTSISSIAVGRFADYNSDCIAVLSEYGIVEILSESKAASRSFATGGSGASLRSNFFSSGPWSHARLVGVHISTAPFDDLLVVDPAGRQLQLLNKQVAATGYPDKTPSHLAASLDAASAPIAVLPMRLNGDALNDLMVLSSGHSAPVLVPTQTTSTFTVTNTNASGPGSLQFAILDANDSPGADLISFNIPGSGTQTISPTAALPTITDAVTIDGTTQPGFQGQPIITLSGSQAGTANGLILAAANCTVRGLSIRGFTGGAAISLRSNNNLIEGNLLFTPLGSPASSVGVNSQGTAQANLIGGTTTAARNVISNNGTNINLLQGATNNKIQGNFIGNDGTTLGGGVGVAFGASVLNGGTSNLVGGTVAGARNIISNIQIYGMSNLIQGNYVGRDVTGLNSLGGNGLIIIRDSLNTIGGTTPAARNLAPGIGVFALGCLVQGNYLGVNVNGQGNLGGIGIFVQDANDTIVSPGGDTIGGAVAGAGNLIANSSLPGVEIASGQGGHSVQGNLIGTDVSGTLDLGNLQNGVYIHDSPNNVVGGTDPAARNIISGNGLSGVLIEGAQATGNVVLGNFIGTNAAGTGALGNDLNGVTTSEAPNNTIGGSVVAARNIISANARHGVSIGIDTSSGATGITVQNNYIGTDVTGNNCLGNGRDGIFVNRGSVNHTITNNLITCNQRNGVNIPNFPTNDPGIRIAITSNSIYANAALGIDLGDPGINANDFQDVDGGANFQQNFGLLSALITPVPNEVQAHRKESYDTTTPLRGDTIYTVDTHLNSTPNTTFTVHWYFSAGSQCISNQLPSRPLAFGRVPGVTTDANGDASVGFAFEFPPGMTSGLINTTTTDPNGNTSESSPCLAVNAPPPTTTMQFSAATYPVNEGAGSVTITVTRAGNTLGGSSVDFAASDDSATQNQDYVVTSGTLNFAAGETSKTFSVLIVDDGYVEPAEAINLTLSSATGGDLAVPGTATVSITDNDSAAVTSPVAKRFGAILNGAQETPANNSQGKGTGYVLLNQGETSAQVGMQFQGLGSAETAAHIHGPAAAGVAAPILFPLPTTNPVTNFQISPTGQQVADLKAGLHYLNVHSTNFANGEIRGQLSWNPTLEENFFVRQQYLDFLSRDGDPGGFGFWVNQVGSCQADALCFHDRTITTSNAFFFEPEFQQTAGYVFRAYRAAFGNNQPFPNPDNSNAAEANKLIDYSAFVTDRARVVGGANLAAAQQAFANQFVLRSAFTSRYAAATTAALFVDAILANIQAADGANLTAQRQALIDQYNSAGGGNTGRAMVLYRLADDNAQNPISNQAFINAEYNRQFALTLYFGYLRRNPDIGGFLFWQSQINLAPLRDVPKQNALVCSFLTAAEYQLRFGPNAPRSNVECPQ